VETEIWGVGVTLLTPITGGKVSLEQSTQVT
jgi:hypothetical protein